MSKKIDFQFNDKLDYQLKAVDSVCQLFKGLPKNTNSIYIEKINNRTLFEGRIGRNPDIIKGEKLLNNLNTVQNNNNLFLDKEVLNTDFTVEMETGTGKTYVYIRTILELHKEYGFNKFIIIVPSIAIRKGVEKSINQLKDHFNRLYNINLSKHSFIYDSKKPGEIKSFVDSNDLNICVINAQAFNSDTNKIQNEDENGRILWDDMKNTRPIVIIDEPQKIEGEAKKKSKTLQTIEKLEPLVTLRYSATHKNKYYQIYKLDSYEAYKKDLVKKIKVKTVNSLIPKNYPYIKYKSFTKEGRAKIEMFSQAQGDVIKFKTFDVESGVSLYELSGKMLQYENMNIVENPNKEKPLRISTNDKDIFLEKGENNYSEIDQKDVVRVQIKLAIKNHFEKQFSILESGKEIKALTLFFIDEVKKVRDFDKSDNRGIYLEIFDEEYKNAIEKYKEKIEKYSKYFPNYNNINLVREGYFAMDKNKKAIEVADYDDENSKKKTPDEILRGIELILDKKDELISFEEPLAFIFSHSALREGWDNPNIFTLCTLKNSNNKIGKKQEIGRGLRLPVDITGKRSLDNNINELTVIANESYEDFSNALQKEYNESLDVNEVTFDVVFETLKNAGIPKEKINEELINRLKDELINNKIINSNNVLLKNPEETRKKIEKMKFEEETLKEHGEKIKEEFIKYMQEKGTNRIEIKNGDNEEIVNKRRNFVTEDEFWPLYKGLNDYLKKRTMYICKIDKEQFIKESIEKINDLLKNLNLKNSIKVTEAKVKNEKEKLVIDMVNEDIEEYTKEDVKIRSDFAIANDIMYHTKMPRLAILKIIQGIENKNLLSSQEILEKVIYELNKKLEETKANNVINYEVINGYELDENKIFEVDDKINEEDLASGNKIFKANKNYKRALNEYYKLDSDGEKEFAQKLENNENVILFTKLKKGGFVISTPYGNYSPDWAVVYRDTTNNSQNGNIGIYFIVESKFDKEKKDLSEVEKCKIECGKLHFKSVSENIKFDWVKGYDDFKSKYL